MADHAAPLNGTRPAFAQAAPVYIANGWHPFPLPPGAKSPPPTGVTGADGHQPTETEIGEWCNLFPDGNVGIRLAPDVLGIDVDEYDNKHGARALQVLEDRHGPLPATWLSTSRGFGPSSIRFYKIPTGTIFPGTLGADIEAIQHHHRYAVVAPSTHDRTGERYRWYGPSGEPAITAPNVTELAALPTAWIEALCLRPYEAPARESVPAGDDSIAEHINHNHDWHTTLVGDGWQLHGHKGDTTEWTRQGKDPRLGISAVLHEPDGPFNVFTTSIAVLCQPWAANQTQTLWAYSMFGYLAATRHHGDRSECARHHRTLLNSYTGNGVPRVTVIAPVDLDQTDPDTTLLAMLIDWPTFWAKDTSDAEWLAEPVIARGRAHAIYAPGGTGKSLFALWLAAEIATGGRGLGHQPMPPARVLYLDYEMTADDVAERLDAMGYGPGTNLTNLHYALLPSLAPADQAEGGRQIARLAQLVDAQIVFLDTFSRAVAGDENDADTVRDFYRWTGMHLKAAGRAFARIDHAGKDVEKGQRGSSAKNDDVDVVWQMTKTEGGFMFTAKKRRMGWIPEHLDLIQTDEPLSYSVTIGSVPHGTKHVADTLDELHAPLDVSYRKAAAALKEAGKGARGEVIRAAIKHRRNRGLTPFECVPPNRDALAGAPQNDPRTHDRTQMETPSTNTTDAPGTHPDAPPDASGSVPVSLIQDAPSVHPKDFWE